MSNKRKARRGRFDLADELGQRMFLASIGCSCKRPKIVRDGLATVKVVHQPGCTLTKIKGMR